MTPERAEHISLLAAPIYAALLAQGLYAPAEVLDAMRKQAIVQAQALWQATLDTPDSDP